MILILGRNGQLSRALQELDWNEEIRVLGSDVLDLDHPEQVRSYLESKIRERPRLLFNAAAYTAVDRAENERDRAFRINAESVGEIGKWARTQSVPVIHFSTDYVFSGLGTEPSRESSPLKPVNTYGESKLAGEKALMENHDFAFIFRISWVVSPFGHNFVKTMLRLGQERQELQVVDDQIGSPMSALAIARLMQRCFGKNPEDVLRAQVGCYNLSSNPYVSWRQFAESIFAEARRQGQVLAVQNTRPIPTSEFPTPARRPQNSRLSDQLFQTTFHDKLGSWVDHLPEIIRRLQ